MLRIMHIVGARPNFPKVAPIMAEMAKRPAQFEQVLVHTGQHYDSNMSQVFFEDLAMPTPDEFLRVGSGSHALQTAAILAAFEPIVLKYRPDSVIVVGDVNSTMACALVCAKIGVRVAHVEAGLRTRDRTLPEEINRVLTDQLSDLLFTPSIDCNENLIREGIDPGRIHFVGNVMIDTLIKLLPRALQRDTLKDWGLRVKEYVVLTLHRPSNVDDGTVLRGLLEAMAEVSRDLPVMFPVHPRTRSRIQELSMKFPSATFRLVEPLGYLELLCLMNSAALVVTDSGGIQEETTFLSVPCLTVRPNTERPITITEGTNRLVRSSYEDLVKACREGLQETQCPREKPALWDGQAGKRIVDIICNL